MAQDRSPGAIFLHRKLRENFLWMEPRVFSRAEAWIDLLMEVRWKDEPEEVVIKNVVMQCGYGESLKSLDTWAKRWRWTKSATRRFFILLEKCGQIDTQSETVTTRIRICNFRELQKLRNADETQMKHKRNADETQMTPEEESKEGKNVKNKENISPELLELSKLFLETQKKNHPSLVKITESKIRSGAKEIEKLIGIDGFDLEETIKPALRWCVKDSFWSDKVLSLAGLRKKSNGNGEMKFVNILASSQQKREQKEEPFTPPYWQRAPVDEY